MNFKTTGLLVGLLILVGVVWLFFPKGQAPDTEGEKPFSTVEAEKPLLDPAPESNSIVRVTVERPEKPRLVFERSPESDKPDLPGNWRAVEPLAAPVENYMVSGIVSTFTALRSQTRFESGQKGAPSDADAGLAPPVATVTLSDKQGKEARLEVGRKAALSSDTYVRVGGGKTIHVVGRDLLTEVKKDFNDYRDKRLATFTPTDAVRVEIQGDGKSYVLTRGEEGAWVLDAPVKAYALKDEVLAGVRKLTNLRAQEFVDDAPTSLAAYGLDSPSLTVSVTTETKRALPPEKSESETQPAEPKYETVATTTTVQFGSPADLKNENRYARLADQPWVVKVKQKDLEGLVPELTKLRDPKITRIKAADATRLELTVEGQTATLEKVGESWQGSGDLSVLETAALTDLLQAFEDLTAIDYILQPEDPAAYGLDRPRAVVSVVAVGNVTPVTVRVGDVTKSARNAYVLRDGQPTAFVVSAAQAARLVVPPLSLRSRSMFAGDEQTIGRVDLVRGSRRYELIREHEQWRMTDPADAPVDLDGARVLVSTLASLRARRVAGRNDDARFGLDRPAITVCFTVDPALAAQTQPASAPTSAPVEHTLRVGRMDSVAYARLDDDPYVFELDETVYRVLEAELINRKLFDFKAEDVVGVTIIATGGTLELAREGEDWKYTPDPFAKLNQKSVKEFIKDLANLHVETYLEYREADLARAGLLAAPATVSIKLKSGELANLKLEQERPGTLPRVGGWVEQKRTFLLRPADSEKLMRGLDYYLKPESPKEGSDQAPGEDVEPPIRGPETP